MQEKQSSRIGDSTLENGDHTMEIMNNGRSELDYQDPDILLDLAKEFQRFKTLESSSGSQTHHDSSSGVSGRSKPNLLLVNNGNSSVLHNTKQPSRSHTQSRAFGIDSDEDDSRSSSSSCQIQSTSSSSPANILSNQTHGNNNKTNVHINLTSSDDDTSSSKSNSQGSRHGKNGRIKRKRSQSPQNNKDTQQPQKKRKFTPTDPCDQRLIQTLSIMPDDPYHTDAVVWASLRGYPKWPARIESSSSTRYKVYFFGEDNSYSLLSAKYLEPFDVELAKRELEKWDRSMTRSSKRQNVEALCKAIREALEEIAGNADQCFYCGEVGYLICCDGCSNAVHMHCEGLTEIPDEYICPECRKKGQESLSINMKRRQNAHALLDEAPNPPNAVSINGKQLNIGAGTFRSDPVKDILTRSYWKHIEKSERHQKHKSLTRRFDSFRKRIRSKKSALSALNRSKKKRQDSKSGHLFNDEIDENENPNTDPKFTFPPRRVSVAEEEKFLHLAQGVPLSEDIKMMEDKKPFLPGSLSYFMTHQIEPLKEKIIRYRYSHQTDEDIFIIRLTKLPTHDPTISAKELKHILINDNVRFDDIEEVRFYDELHQGWSRVDFETDDDNSTHVTQASENRQGVEVVSSATSEASVSQMWKWNFARDCSLNILLKVNDASFANGHEEDMMNDLDSVM